MCVFQVYLTGMVPLAVRPTQPLHVDFNHYYVPPGPEFRRFANKEVWRDAIFAHVNCKYPEWLMVRLWQCVEANHEGRIAPSLDDLIGEPPPTPVWLLWSIVAASGISLLICLVLVLRLRRIK